MFPPLGSAGDASFVWQTDQDRHEPPAPTHQVAQTGPHRSSEDASGVQAPQYSGFRMPAGLPGGAPKPSLTWDQEKAIVAYAQANPAEICPRIASEATRNAVLQDLRDHTTSTYGCVARVHNVAPATARRLALGAGVRTVEADSHRGKRVPSAERERIARFAHAHPGASYSAIANQFGRDRVTVRGILHAYGIRRAPSAAFGSARQQEIAAAAQAAPERLPVPSGEAVDAPLDLSVRPGGRRSPLGNDPAVDPIIERRGSPPDDAAAPEQQPARPAAGAFWRPW
jgi:transposase-like protein